MKKAWVICRKEIREIFRSKYILSTFFLPIVIFGIVMPMLLTVLSGAFLGRGKANFPPGFEKILPDYCQTDRQRLVYFAAFFFTGPLLLMVPLMTPTFIAADSFSGEKERKTIEPLLATPTSDLELFLGKVLTAFIPSIIVSFLTFLTATSILGVTSIQVFGWIIFPDLTYLLMMVVTAPLATILSIGFMVLVSARIANVRDAAQFGGILVLPVILLLFGQIFTVFMINVFSVLAITVVFALVDVLLIRAASSSFGRENILMKL